MILNVLGLFHFWGWDETRLTLFFLFVGTVREKTHLTNDHYGGKSC